MLKEKTYLNIVLLQDLNNSRTGLWDNDPQSLGGDDCRQVPQRGILSANIRGQQSQQMVKNGVCHPEKVPEIIRIILLDLTKEKANERIGHAGATNFWSMNSSPPCSRTGLGSKYEPQHQAPT
ncbi:hypothetical protein AB205_0132380 [Aquarana catesbeiana]|uniref:Uncharacterized protein n=1 Tax=Aquarana catesbeiana TaxID=8400 RepID=A0A2G9QKF8_AQUCT|nr:hypothetical protein AB205_0132380 [Aquarana catesbeiana]